jgi:hypothetical protein
MNDDNSALRDQFAMAALTGLLADSRTVADAAGPQRNLAERAYQIANAMLEARHDVKLPERFRAKRKAEA